VRLAVPRADAVTDEVVIARLVRDVYAFYRDFANLPRFLGDVVAVEHVDDRSYRWVVAGPLGARLNLTVTIVEERVDEVIRFQTRGPASLRAQWRLDFAADQDGRATRVREQLTMPLGALGRSVLALIGKFPDREVRDDLNRLRQLLESGAPPQAGQRGPR
jgi:uncharacterized membrane protein